MQGVELIFNTGLIDNLSPKLANFILGNNCHGVCMYSICQVLWRGLQMWLPYTLPYVINCVQNYDPGSRCFLWMIVIAPLIVSDQKGEIKTFVRPLTLVGSIIITYVRHNSPLLSIISQYGNISYVFNCRKPVGIRQTVTMTSRKISEKC